MLAVCAAAALGAALYAAVRGAASAASPAAAAVPPPAAAMPAASAGGAPPGTFRLTDEQLRSLQVEAVTAMPFHSQIVTEGRIAYDGDTLTPVYSPFSGRVTRVIAPLGASVVKGAVLFTLDASEFAQAESDLAAAAAQVEFNTQIERRRQAQYQARGVSLQDWQQAQNDLTASRAALAAVRNRLRILGVSDARIEALLAAARAGLGSAAPDAQASALAPISGVVVDRQIGPGQYLQAGGSTPVYTVADLSRVWLVAEVPEAQAARVHVGQSVTASVIGLPQRSLHARLSYVAAAVDPSTRRLTVHAVLDNRDGALKPEMFATLTIVTSADSMAPAVPERAIIYEGDQARVWILRDSHDAGLRLVRLGRSLDGRVEVLGGLAVGDQVITRGALFIDRAASGD
jgi:cobalt-zinc-cadmium efflux system membrane fusion protein